MGSVVTPETTRGLAVTLKVGERGNEARVGEDVPELVGGDLAVRVVLLDFGNSLDCGRSLGVVDEGSR